jgi:cytosine/creatinine deaminase
VDDSGFKHTAEAATRVLLLRGGHDADGAPLDVLIAGEHIAAAGAGAASHQLAGQARAVDMAGRTLLPAAAEPHAHLDKALLGGSAVNRDGTLTGALAAMRAAPMTRDEILRRARRAAAIALRHGFTAIRSHVDVARSGDLSGVEALTQLGHELEDLLDLQLVALVSGPVAGRDGRDLRRRLGAALDHGCHVVGGAPWLGDTPDRSIDELTAAAADAGLPIDLHLDETTDPGQLTLVRYLRRVEQLGLGGRATASHCVSLGQQTADQARSLARALASAGVALVTLPQTNLGLQGRGEPTLVPRALPPVGMLEQDGVLLAAGGDNWRDPFNPVGRIDPMETASLLVAAGHLPPGRAYQLVSGRARAVIGLPPASLAPGDVADLLAIGAEDLAEAVASGTEDRKVWHRGRLVADTNVGSMTGLDLL